MGNLTFDDYQYLYGQLINAKAKLSEELYRKLISGEDFTEEEEHKLKKIIEKERT